MVAFIVARSYPGQDGQRHYQMAGAFESVFSAGQLTATLDAGLNVAERDRGVTYSRLPVAQWRKLSCAGVAR